MDSVHSELDKLFYINRAEFNVFYKVAFQWMNSNAEIVRLKEATDRNFISDYEMAGQNIID